MLSFEKRNLLSLAKLPFLCQAEGNKAKLEYSNVSIIDTGGHTFNCQFSLFSQAFFFVVGSPLPEAEPPPKSYDATQFLGDSPSAGWGSELEE